MPATNVTNARLDTSILDKMTAEMKPKAKKIVEKYGLAIAKTAATEHPWKLRTGALSNSIMSESKMTGELLFTVQDGVEYGVFLELGHTKTVRSGTYDVPGFSAAYPFMVPAVEKWRERFYSAFAELFR